MSLTAHYIAPDFKLTMWTTACKYFPEQHTSDNIDLEVEKIGISEECQRFMTVDNAANMLGAVSRSAQVTNELRCPCPRTARVDTEAVAITQDGRFSPTVDARLVPKRVINYCLSNRVFLVLWFIWY
jgi:hypothetical protein